MQLALAAAVSYRTKRRLFRRNRLRPFTQAHRKLTGHTRGRRHESERQNRTNSVNSTHDFDDTIKTFMGLSAPSLGARFWSLIGATFLGFLGIGTVLPGLAPHLRNDLGGSDQTVGFVIGIFSFVALAARFFSGPLADRRGRKTAFLTGLASCSLAGVAYLLPLGIAGAFLARILQGLGEACLYTGAAAWVVEMAGIERSAQALGYLSSAIWGGVSAGPVVGHWLGSFERAAFMQVVAALVAFAALTRIPESYQPVPHAQRRRWIPRSIIAPGIAIGFVNVHYPVIAGFLILYLAKHGNSGGAAFSAYALLILLSRFFLGGLPDRIPPAITFYGGLVAMAAGLVDSCERPRAGRRHCRERAARLWILVPVVVDRLHRYPPNCGSRARLGRRSADRVLRSFRGAQLLRRRRDRRPLRLFRRVHNGRGGPRRRRHRRPRHVRPRRARVPEPTG